MLFAAPDWWFRSLLAQTCCRICASVELRSSVEYVQTKPLHLNASWIINCMRKADKNEDNKMTLKELKHFLRQINVEVDDTYAEDIFKVRKFIDAPSYPTHLHFKISVLTMKCIVHQTSNQICLNDCSIVSHVA